MLPAKRRQPFIPDLPIPEADDIYKRQDPPPYKDDRVWIQNLLAGVPAPTNVLKRALSSDEIKAIVSRHLSNAQQEIQDCGYGVEHSELRMKWGLTCYMTLNAGQEFTRIYRQPDLGWQEDFPNFEKKIQRKEFLQDVQEMIMGEIQYIKYETEPTTNEGSWFTAMQRSMESERRRTGYSYDTTLALGSYPWSDDEDDREAACSTPIPKVEIQTQQPLGVINEETSSSSEDEASVRRQEM